MFPQSLTHQILSVNLIDVMLFTFFHQFPSSPRRPFSLSHSNHDIFLTIPFLIFYLIFPAHVMKEDNDGPKTLYSGTKSI